MSKRRQPLTASLLTISTFVVTATAWSTEREFRGSLLSGRRRPHREAASPGLHRSAVSARGRSAQQPTTPTGEGVPPPVARSVEQVLPPLPVEDTGRAPRRRVMERAPPASISPIPRPGLTDFVDSVPMPDRWRIVDTLGYKERWWDPYNRNVLKADKPVAGERLVLQSGPDLRHGVRVARSAARPSARSRPISRAASMCLAAPISGRWRRTSAPSLFYYKGNTVFKPPDWEFRVTPVVSYNYTGARGSAGRERRCTLRPHAATTHLVGLQAAFVDRHLRNVSDNYDFDSFRVGIQPFFVGLPWLPVPGQPAGCASVRYPRQQQVAIQPSAYFRRLEKDLEQRLNDVEREARAKTMCSSRICIDRTSLCSALTSQATVLYNRQSRR